MGGGGSHPMCAGLPEHLVRTFECMVLLNIRVCALIRWHERVLEVGTALRRKVYDALCAVPGIR